MGQAPPVATPSSVLIPWKNRILAADRLAGDASLPFRSSYRPAPSMMYRAEMHPIAPGVLLTERRFGEGSRCVTRCLGDFNDVVRDPLIHT